MHDNIEITITDRQWPELELVVKHGQKVQKEVVRQDQALTKFQSVVNSFVQSSVEGQIKRRKQYGS